MKLKPIEVIETPERVERAITWIEGNFKVTVGETAGQPFVLAPFQRDVIRDLYGYADARTPHKRLTNKLGFSVGRKAGKSDLAALIVLLNLIGPESTTHGSIISGATTYKQASLVFKAAVRFLESAPNLMKYVRIIPTRSTIAVIKTTKPNGLPLRCRGSTYQAIAAEAGSAQGLNPNVVVMDELAQATDGGTFYRALEASQKAQADPLMVVISTQAADPEHTLSQLLQSGLKRREDTTCSRPANFSCPHCNVHQRTAVHLYAAPNECDLLDPAAHLAANPAYGLWIDPDRFMDEAKEAADNPASEGHFRLYALNQQVSQHTTVLTRSQWERCLMEGPAVKDRDQKWFAFQPKEAIYLGLDLSKRTDLTALVAVTAEGVRIKSWFWKPEPDLAKAIKTDDVRYDLYRERGWLIANPAPTIELEYIALQIKALQADYDVRALAYDPAYQGDLLKLLSDNSIASSEDTGDGLRIVPWHQGFISMNHGVNAIDLAVKNGELRTDGNPLLTNHVLNAVVKTDPAGNRKFDKSASRFRIDGAVAMAMAMAVRAQDIVEASAPNPFDDEGFEYFYG